jgi:hypothetical protein
MGFYIWGEWEDAVMTGLKYLRYAQQCISKNRRYFGNKKGGNLKKGGKN